MAKPEKVVSVDATPPRRHFLQTAVLGAAGSAIFPALAGARETVACAPAAHEVTPFELDELTIADLQAAIASGKFTGRSLTQKYIDRIEAVDRRGPAVNSVIELNPDALAMAEGLDKERKAKGARGPLHGIPVLIKDNIDTADRMHTTAGSLALLGSHPARDAFVAQKLREAGAVILGKTNLSEWANIRSSHSVSGWSGRGGLTRNPYALDRNPCGSSSGSGAATAANLCTLAVGTETDGSVVCPSNANGTCGDQADAGFDQPLRHRSHCAQSGHRGTHGADGARRRDSAERAGGFRSARRCDRCER